MQCAHEKQYEKHDGHEKKYAKKKTVTRFVT